MANEPLDDFDFEIDAIDEEFDAQSHTTTQHDDADAKAAQALATTRASIDEQLPAQERIATLFREMKTRRRVLLKLIDYLNTPRQASDFGAEVERLQEYDYSVFTAANYSDLLEQAGAIQKCTENGDSLEGDFKQKPEIVEVDGVEYYKPADRPKVFWVATAEGIAYREEDRPYDRLVETMDSDKPEYLVVYRLLLQKCDTDEGCKTPELDSFFKTDETIGELGVYASRFTDRLERCEALEWCGTWKTTDIGRRGLARYSSAALLEESEA